MVRQPPLLAATIALLDAHLGDDTVEGLQAACGRFTAEMELALVVAADAEERLPCLIEIGERLAAEEGSLSAPGWVAFLESVNELRLYLPLEASAMVADIEAYLHDQA